MKIIGFANPNGSGKDNWSETEAESAERIRAYVKAGRLGTALAILRTFDPAARGRVQAAIRAERRGRVARTS